ncbi:hypothetical protein OA84_10415 [Kaistella solincola]|uniref:Uncharacterized protein n=1 Tax=Kaistella solincola TaxID=510955 RepID=A0ABR4ZNV0_9FLAO|nr:hypothetical protein OA84_10415 [Kaistella solincola]
MECLSTTEHLNNELLIWTKEYEKYNELNDDKMVEFCLVKTDNITPLYINALDNYSILLAKNLKAIRNRMQKLKKEFK